MVPDDCCFALVGDADALDGVAGVAEQFELLDRSLNAFLYGRYQLERIMLVPSKTCQFVVLARDKAKYRREWHTLVWYRSGRIQSGVKQQAHHLG